jgi:hypothetical protein
MIFKKPVNYEKIIRNVDGSCFRSSYCGMWWLRRKKLQQLSHTAPVVEPTPADTTAADTTAADTTATAAQ